MSWDTLTLHPVQCTSLFRANLDLSSLTSTPPTYRPSFIMDFSVLDEELFGNISSESNNRHEHICATTFNSPSEDERRLSSLLTLPSGHGLELVLANIVWIKTRLTDAHQLLLHFLNLREAYRSLTIDLKKEAVLRTETLEALGRIREQQDQSSEDIPKLQFQIAQLKSDYQKERAARSTAEVNLAEVNERNREQAAVYSSQQIRISDYKSKEREWKKERTELELLVQNLLKKEETGQAQHENGFSHRISGRQEG